VDHPYPSPIRNANGDRRWLMAARGTPSVSDEEVVELLNHGSMGHIVYGEEQSAGPDLSTLHLDAGDCAVSDRLHQAAEALYALRSAAQKHPAPELLAWAWAGSRSIWARAICNCDTFGWSRPPSIASWRPQRPIIYQGFHPNFPNHGPGSPATPTSLSPASSPAAGPGAGAPPPPVLNLGAPAASAASAGPAPAHTSPAQPALGTADPPVRRRPGRPRGPRPRPAPATSESAGPSTRQRDRA
jgi:hypothetical protein